MNISYKYIWNLALSTTLVLNLNATPLQDIISKSKNKIVTKNVGNQIIVEYTLSDEASKKLNDLAGKITIDPYENWNFYKVWGKDCLLKSLPSDLIALIQNMRKNNQPTALVVHNMPIDNVIPETPRTGNRPHDKTYVSETMILGVCSLLDAFPEYDEREKDGTYINQIIPRDDAKSKSQASSFGSEIPFFPHTENVYQEPPLKFFALTCLRGDPKVSTSVIFLDKILEYLKSHLPKGMTYEQVVTEMEKAQFVMKTGPSFENAKDQKVLPILTKNELGERIYRFNANVDRMEGTNAVATMIIEHIKNILLSDDFIESNYNRFYLKKGDYLLFNNWEVMHARDAFKIDPNNWRWLQRCYYMLNEHAKASKNIK